MPEHHTLADYFHNLPSDVYPVGRLDKDSEGLLLLTNDKKLTDRLLNPRFGHPRTYWVQVDGAITNEAIQQLQHGVDIKLKKGLHRTMPCLALTIKNVHVPDRDPPIRYRKNIPTSWLAITLKEGKNRQVRKMCAAVGFPVLRLIRMKIGDLDISGWQPGDIKYVTRQEIRKHVLTGIEG